MARINNIMPLVRIKIAPEKIAKRLLKKNSTTGIGEIAKIKENRSLETLLKYRDRFYEAAADITFTPSGCDADQTVNEFIRWAYDQHLHLVAVNWKSFKLGVDSNIRAQVLSGHFKSLDKLG